MPLKISIHINWQLSSNGIEGTGDFANRSIINRISKQPAGYKFGTYSEGNIFAHIKEIRGRNLLHYKAVAR